MKIEKYYDITDVPYERKSKERILTGFDDLDYYMKGIEIGVTLLVANTNAGKSTFVQGVLARAIEQGYNAWAFSGEHTAESFQQLLFHQNSTKADYEPIPYVNWKGEKTNIVDWYVTASKEQELKSRFKDHLFFYSNKAPRTIEAMLDSMTECYKTKNTRFFLIDNLISIDNITSNVFAEQTRITEQIRTFALNNKVFVLLVAHQRKNAEKGGFILDIQDVAGSQNISNKAYNVVAQYRIDMLPKEVKDYDRLTKYLADCGFDITKCDGVLQVMKTKGNGYGWVGLKYDAETLTYRQADKVLKTKADEIVKQSSAEQLSLIGLTPVDDSDDDLGF